MKFITLEFEIKREKHKTAEDMGFKTYNFTVKKNGKKFFHAWETHVNIQRAKRMGTMHFLRMLYDGKIKLY